MVLWRLCRSVCPMWSLLILAHIRTIPYDSYPNLPNLNKLYLPTTALSRHGYYPLPARCPSMRLSLPQLLPREAADITQDSYFLPLAALDSAISEI